MFKLIALFALVAVAAAEPEADSQWVSNYWDVTPHLKTHSGDTVSVAAAKNHHLGLKAHEYAKKAHVYSPYVYNVHNAGVYSPYTYAHTTGVYNAYPYYHHLYKREAEAEPEAESDAALVYRTNYQGYPFYNTGVYSTYPRTYNTGVYSAYPYTYNTAAYSAYPHNYMYNHVFKREAESDSQYLYNTFNGYNGFNFNRFNGFYNGYTPYTNFYNRGMYYY
jgi:hypothetical protein